MSEKGSGGWEGEAVESVGTWDGEIDPNAIDWSDFFDYCEAGIDEETDIGVRLVRRDELAVARSILCKTPGYVIARASDVLTPEDRQTIRWAELCLKNLNAEYDCTEEFQESEHLFPSANDENVDGHLSRLRAIAQGGNDGE